MISILKGGLLRPVHVEQHLSRSFSRGVLRTRRGRGRVRTILCTEEVWGLKFSPHFLAQALCLGLLEGGTKSTWVRVVALERVGMR